MEREQEPQDCEVCGKRKTDIPFLRVEVNVDEHCSWHYVCSEECLQQVEDVLREEG